MPGTTISQENYKLCQKYNYYKQLWSRVQMIILWEL